MCDGTDNFATRFLVADACVLARRTLVSGAVLRFDGQLSVFRPHLGGPCYRCLYPEPPPPGLVPSCSEAGVLGAVTGVIGTLQATEVLKEIMGIGDTLAGRLLVWDALASRFRTVKLPRDPDCALCGPQATIRDLSAHAEAAAEQVRGRPVPSEPLGVLLLSGAHDRAHYAFVLASGAAALGRRVVLFATNAGCHALFTDWSGLTDAARDDRVRAAGVAGLAELREASQEMGVRLIACEAGLRAEGLDAARLMPGVEVAGVATFLEAVGAGQIVAI